MKVRESRVLRNLHAGKIVTSVKINLNDPRVVEIAAMCGFEACWLDMEHVPTDWQFIENSVRAAKNYDTDVVVRISKGSYSDYNRPFEADASGIIVPHVTTKKEAEDLVKMTKFYPIGLRPVDGGNADGKYCLVDFVDYLEQSNREKFVIIQIEDVEALEELEEIISVKGLDMIFFGPADFSHSLGKPGCFDDKLLLETKRLIPKLCKKYGKYAATVGSPNNFQELVDMGYSYINIGADVVGLSNYYTDLKKKTEVNN